MKRIAFTVLLVAAPLLEFGESPAGAQPAGNAQTERIIVQMEDDWAAALVRADAATIDRIVAPEWTLAEETGKLLPKAMTDADLRSGNYKVASFKNNEVKVRVYGTTAIVSGLETQTSTYQGKDSSGQYRFTDVFINRNGVWKVVATHVSKVTKD